MKCFTGTSSRLAELRCLKRTPFLTSSSYIIRTFSVMKRLRGPLSSNLACESLSSALGASVSNTRSGMTTKFKLITGPVLHAHLRNTDDSGSKIPTSVSQSREELVSADHTYVEHGPVSSAIWIPPGPRQRVRSPCAWYVQAILTPLKSIQATEISKSIQKDPRVTFGTSDLLTRAYFSGWAKKFPTCLPTDVEERLLAVQQYFLVKRPSASPYIPQTS